MFAQTLVSLDRKVRGWGNSFREIDQRLEFKQLDGQIRSRVSEFIGWYTKQTKGLPDDYRMRALGVALLHDTPPRDLIEE